MKPIMIVMLCFLLFSCSTTLNYIPTETSYYAIDFRKYSKDGFLITPEKINKDYESIGVVKYVIVPGARYQVDKSVRYPDGTLANVQKWQTNKITLSQGLDSLYSWAKGMGANAIINFSATTTQRNYQSISNPITLEGYELNGFAIRIK